MAKPQLLALFWAASACGLLMAQGDQYEQKGFSPEKAFQVGEVDAVNIFNGNLSVNIPLGQRYPVGGTLEYGLNLTYTGPDYWIGERDNTCTGSGGTPVPCPDALDYIGDPAPYFNAGFGWMINPGMVIKPAHQGRYFTKLWRAHQLHKRYLSPDGAQHLLYDELHEGESSTGASYTRDNTYLRLKSVSGGYTIELPNGHVHEFLDKVTLKTVSTDPVYPGIGDGFTVAEAWRLTKISDPFGNWVTFSYGTTAWTISDSTGRSHTVQMRYVDALKPYTFTEGYIVDYVDMAAADGTTARYDISHQETEISEGCSGSDYDQDLYPRSREQFFVQEVTGLVRPAGGDYAMDSGLGLNCDPAGLTSLTLPTLGEIQWSYDHRDMPVNNEDTLSNQFPDPSVTSVRTVSEKTLYHADGTEEGRWQYAHELYPQYSGVTSKPKEVRVHVKDPEGYCTTHFYDTDPGWSSSGSDAGWAYGLPFSQSSTKNQGRFLSIAERTGTTTSTKTNLGFECSGEFMRQRYVVYDHDTLPAIPTGALRDPWSQTELHDSNRRLKEMHTVYDDDGDRFAGTVFSDFDGLGHYRTATTNGNFSSGNVRTATTNFNPDVGTYPSGTYQPPTPADDWVLGTFSDRSVTEGSTTYKEQLCFEASTGFLERKRTQAGTAAGTGRQAKDLIVDYTRDDAGFTTFERYYGGDGIQDDGVTSRAVSTNSNLCAISFAAESEEYEIEHSPTNGHGTVRWIRYNQDDGPGTWTYVAPVHRNVDANTALPIETIDNSDLRVFYSYDGLGRPTVVQPDANHEGARAEYSYTNAVGTTPAKVDIDEEPNASGDNSKLSARRLQFDGFGRVIREERKRPNGSWVGSTTEYTPRGFTSRVSTTWTGAPTTWTTTTYDQFGRPLTVTPPDGAAHAVTLSYQGVRLVNRTVNIQTGSGEIPQTTTEEYDRQGRLFRLTEPTGTVTTYGYDPADRLASVSMNGDGTTQTRTFNYDGRGFLVTETHPEKTGVVRYTGFSSNGGEIDLGGYDSRGHARRKKDGDSDLRFKYDRSERVTEVKETGGNVLKELVYAIANGSGSGANQDRVRGKLQSATRHNYLPGFADDSDVLIREDYIYRGVGGGPTRRTTYKNGAEILRLGSSYNALGLTSNVCYPAECGGGGTTEVLYDYTNGFLTSVTDYAPVITYHPNLMLQQVDHSNGVDDVWDVSTTDRMRRPTRIRTTGSTDANFNTGTYLYDGAGNITDIGNDIFNYDSVSRLVYGTAQGGAYSEENTYDAFGNRIVASSMGLTRTNPVNPLTNRLTGAPYRPISYDGAGNMTQWGTATYSYDDLQMTNRFQDSGDNEYYLYTADDERVAIIEANGSNSQTSARWMLRDFQNQVVRTNTQGGFGGTLLWEKDYIRREGQMLAKKIPGPTITHAHLDHLGTPRYWTNSTAGAVERHDYLPFGEEVTAPTLNPEQAQFTGHERDGHLSGGCGSGITGVNNQTLSTQQQFVGCDEIRSENTTVTTTGDVRYTAGLKIVLKNDFSVEEGGEFVAELDGNLKATRQDLDYMHARYCSPYLGRFAGVDPIDSSNQQDPQTWNQFTYSLNNPIRFVDPDGEAPIDPGSVRAPDAEAVASDFKRLSRAVARVVTQTVLSFSETANSFNQLVGGIHHSQVDQVVPPPDNTTDAVIRVVGPAVVTIGALRAAGVGASGVVGGRTIRTDIVLSGGRGGSKVKNLVGPPNSVVRGSQGRVFVTNKQGQVVLDITENRVKPVTPGRGFDPKRDLTEGERALWEQVKASSGE